MFDGFQKHYYEALELRSQKVNICSDFVLAAAKPQVDQHPELNPRLQPYDVDKLAAILERLTSHQRDLILAMAEHDRMPVESALRQVAELENVIAAVESVAIDEARRYRLRLMWCFHNAQASIRAHPRTGVLGMTPVMSCWTAASERDGVFVTTIIWSLRPALR
jgi:hypothetical protein